MAKQDLQKLIDQFNQQDVSAVSTRDNILKNFADSRSGVKNYNKAERDRVFGEQALTEQDIEQLRQDRLRRKAIEQGLQIAKAHGKTTQRIKDIQRAGTLRAGANSIASIAKKRNAPQASSVQDQWIDKTRVIHNSPSLDLPSKAGAKSVLNTISGQAIDTDAEKFEQSFLISTKGMLNHDVLLDILTDTWDKFQNLNPEEDKDSEGQSSSLLGWALGALAMLRGLGKKLKELKNLAKNIIKAVSKKVSALASKIANSLKGILKKLPKIIKDAIKTATKVVVEASKKAAKVVQAATQQASKILGQTVSKVTKGGVQAGKSALKKVTSSIKGLGKVFKGLPLADAIVGGGFDVYEIASSDKPSEVAAAELLDQKKQDGLQGLDWISPYAIGQQAALAVGVDKVGGWIGDKIGSAISALTFGTETPAEKINRLMAERGIQVQPKTGDGIPLLSGQQVKQATAAPVEQSTPIRIPEEISNPQVRPQITEITKPQPIQQTPLPNVKLFKLDTNEAPVYGMHYQLDF